MTVELTSAEESKSIIIPPGCAHGFQTLEDNTIVSYAMSADYGPQYDRGINPLDLELGIDWPLEISDISARDLALPKYFEEG
jgi:dTDP-4-dehydrorhamnose 3,5-epimerase